MESLRRRQVSSATAGSDHQPQLAQDPETTIHLVNLTSATTSATTDIIKNIPSSLGPLPQMSSTANREMEETSAPPPAANAVAVASSQPPPGPAGTVEVEATNAIQASEESTAIESEEKGKENATSSAPLSLDSHAGESPAEEEEAQARSNTTSPITDVASPVCNIMLLLTSGARHGYKVDERYLLKRQMTIPGVTETGKKDPYSISVIMLKELILREWREEWDAKPSSPSSIRLIYFGRLLNDNAPLKECRFNEHATNVVHMTVRPQDIVDEEESERKRAEARQHDRPEQTPGCGRCVIL